MVCCGHNGNAYVQTLFQGASIVKFSSSAGWNGSGGGLQVEVVEDKCNGSKVYVDAGGNARIYEGPDHFNPDEIGSPVYFNYGGFSYCGILKKWKEKNSSTGAKTYTLEVQDPSEILEGTQVILSSYNGPVYGTPNLLNVYGFLEDFFGSTCVDSGFGTYPPAGFPSALTYRPAQAYGGVNGSDAGLSWQQIRYGLNLLINSVTPNIYGDSLKFKNFSYYLDLSELPSLNPQIKISGENRSLLDIISEVCDLAGKQFFLEITPNIASGNNNIYGHLSTSASHYIKVRVVSSPLQANEQSAADIDTAVGADIDSRLNLGVIGGMINNHNCLNTYSRGLELRLKYTNAFITGDFRRDIWQMDYSGEGDGGDTIWPYWGRDPVTDELLTPTGYAWDSETIVDEAYDIENDHSFEVNMGHLGVPGVNTVRVSFTELRAAKISIDTWVWWLRTHELEKYEEQYKFFGRKKLEDGDFLAEALKEEAKKTLDHVPLSKPDAKITDVVKEKLLIVYSERIYKFIRGLCDNFFGKKFMVKLPYLCLRENDDSPYMLESNWQKADSGWAEGGVLGLDDNSPYLAKFRQDDGTIRGFVHIQSDNGYPLDIGYSANVGNTRGDSFIRPNLFEMWSACTVEEIIWFSSSDARAVISIPSPVSSIDGSTYWSGQFLNIALEAQQARDAGKEPDKDKAEKRAKGVGAANLQGSLAPIPIMPDKAAVPLISNRLVYGPWFARADTSVYNFYDLTDPFGGNDNGKTHYERNTSYTPWNFGSTALMNMAAFIQAEARLGDKYVGETGNITVPGAPANNLGDLLRANGPIISSIDVSIGRGKGEVTTNIQMKTYENDFGKLAQAQIEHIRRIGARATNAKTIFRKYALEKFEQQLNQSLQVAAIFEKAIRTYKYSGESSADVMTASAWADGSSEDDHARSVVMSEDIRKAIPFMRADDDDEYKKRAVMENIGIFRGFSTQTDGSDNQYFPHFESQTHESGCPNQDKQWMSKDNNQFNTQEQLPPIWCKEEHLPIVVGTLSPFLGKGRSIIGGSNVDGICMVDPNDVDPGESKGHDIEYISRDGTYPVHLNVRQPEDNYSESHWYRGVAFRGPMIMAGWGFDIDNKPVPNASEDYPDNPKMAFKKDWLRKPQDWKCGPIDLRWDHRRKVWTCPPAYKLVKVELLENLLPGRCAPAVLHSDDKKYHYNGLEIEKDSGCAYEGYKIKVHSISGRPVLKGTTVLAFYNTYDDKYVMCFHSEIQLVEAVVNSDIACTDGTATITGFVGTTDICNAVMGNAIIYNPLKQPLCAGQKVIGYITNMLPYSYVDDIPEKGDCDTTCNTCIPNEAPCIVLVVLQAEFRKEDVITQLELIEYTYSEEKTYTQEETEDTPENIFDKVLFLSEDDFCVYTSVDITGLSIQSVLREIDDAYVKTTSGGCPIQADDSGINITFDGYVKDPSVDIPALTIDTDNTSLVDGSVTGSITSSAFVGDASVAVDFSKADLSGEYCECYISGTYVFGVDLSSLGLSLTLGNSSLEVVDDRVSGSTEATTIPIKLDDVSNLTVATGSTICSHVVTELPVKVPCQSDKIDSYIHGDAYACSYATWNKQRVKFKIELNIPGVVEYAWYTLCGCWKGIHVQTASVSQVCAESGSYATEQGGGLIPSGDYDPTPCSISSDPSAVVECTGHSDQTGCPDTSDPRNSETSPGDENNIEEVSDLITITDLSHENDPGRKTGEINRGVTGIGTCSDNSGATTPSC